MTTDFENWGGTRKPLPDWWIEAGGRDPNYPLWRGIRFVLRQGHSKNTREWRCVVRRATFDLIAKSELSDEDLLAGWNEHEGRFTRAAKMKVLSRRIAAGRQVTVELTDLDWD